MIKFRYLTLILLSLCSPLILNAQDKEIMKCEDSMSEVKLAVRAGHNAVFGGFLAMSLETDQTIYKDFAISGGVQYNTIGRTALEARPTYILDFDWGRIAPELLLHIPISHQSTVSRQELELVEILEELVQNSDTIITFTVAEVVR